MGARAIICALTVLFLSHAGSFVFVSSLVRSLGQVPPSRYYRRIRWPVVAGSRDLRRSTQSMHWRGLNGQIPSSQSKEGIALDAGTGNDDAQIITKGENNRLRHWRQYFSMMRPVTIIQAVGAFLVGRLAIASRQPMGDPTTAVMPLVMASISIYLSYGAGMAMNDCADAIVDSRHASKRNRSVASRTVSSRDARTFCFVLSAASMAFSFLAKNPPNTATIDGGGLSFAGWTALNLSLMAGYALGMQKLFLAKNLICGFLAISPLVGASLLGDGGSMGDDAAAKLCQLAAIGFPLQVSREILKDAEDIEVDRGVKRTLPLAIGEEGSRRVAYGIVAAVNGAMLLSPYYWRMFASKPPVYVVSVALGTPMCFVASRLPLAKGQRLLKKSIYVLLLGMISGLLLQ